MRSRLMGVPERKILREDAVPSIFVRRSQPPVRQSSRKRIAAAESRSRADQDRIDQDISRVSMMDEEVGDGWLPDTPSTHCNSSKKLAGCQLVFRFTCLEKKRKISNINYDDLRRKGLGIPPSEMVNGKRIPTKIPSWWSLDEMRLKISKLFPRLREFRMYRYAGAGDLTRVTAKTVREIRREIKKSCLYIVPYGPLGPLEEDDEQSSCMASDDPPTYLIDSPGPSEDSNDAVSQAGSLRSVSPSVCALDGTLAPLEPSNDVASQPESLRSVLSSSCALEDSLASLDVEEAAPEDTCTIRNCGGSDFTLHSFPKDEAVAQRWADFVRYTRRDFVPSRSDRICSRHFRGDAYEAVAHLYRLKPTAVPTILYAYRGDEEDDKNKVDIDRRPSFDRSEPIGKSLSPVKQPKDMLHFVKLTDINAYITCFLCGGYMYNATTITECLHSFCRKCILQHLQKDNKCPTCDILIHESIPFHFIRQDGLLQMIINKLIPSFESTEKEAEKKLQEEQPSRPATPVPLLPTAETVPIYSKVISSAQISLQLEYMGASSDCPPIRPLEKSFVRVSGMATIRHVQKFISHKLQLGEEFEVDIICGEEILQPAVILYNLKREVEKEQIIDNILVLSYSLGLVQ